ncbi:Transcriptional activator [Clydaea vesicula]|uniref:Transcriptional activator HAP2 n=1 Tax=Clydaea vesicula TaxID=447962 RepID=A0AAD5U5A0_9FUNG|nr:Transcriptional activator [Clydaea vesicula]
MNTQHSLSVIHSDYPENLMYAPVEGGYEQESISYNHSVSSFQHSDHLIYNTDETYQTQESYHSENYSQKNFQTNSANLYDSSQHEHTLVYAPVAESQVYNSNQIYDNQIYQQSAQREQHTQQYVDSHYNHSGESQAYDEQGYIYPNVQYGNLIMGNHQTLPQQPSEPNSSVLTQQENLNHNSNLSQQIPLNISPSPGQAQSSDSAEATNQDEPMYGYIHESRHRHAMRRPRGPGGRFLSAAELAALDAQGQLKDDLNIVSTLSNQVLNNTHQLLQPGGALGLELQSHQNIMVNMGQIESVDHTRIGYKGLKELRHLHENQRVQYKEIKNTNY